MNPAVVRLLEELELTPLLAADAATPLEELQIDSLRTLELVACFETEFGVEVPDELLVALVDAGDLLRFLDVRSDSATS
jgi:acyl carrier protein